MSPYRSIQKTGTRHAAAFRPRWPRLGSGLLLLALGGLLGVGLGLGLGVAVRHLHPPAPVVHVPPPSVITDPAVWREREKETLEEIRKHIDSLTPGLGGGPLLGAEPPRSGRASPTRRP